MHTGSRAHQRATALTGNVASQQTDQIHSRNMSEWNKVFSLRYRSQQPVPMTRFSTLINDISEQLGQQVEQQGDDFLFTTQLDGVPCIAAVVLFDRERIVECQLTVLTNSTRMPSDLTGLDPVHQLIEACFVIA